jgi:hypothetical protein
MSFPVQQKRDKSQTEFSIEVCGIYFATQTARLTFRDGHVLGFVHYVGVRCVTDSFKEVSADIFEMELNRKRKVSML